jgi:Ca2+-binding RTX toxin-like protein
VTVDLSIGRGQNTLGAGTDKLIDIEAVVGSAYGDTLEGSEADERFTGGLGNDSIDGGDGIDTLLYTTYLTAGAVAGVDVDLSTGTATGGAGDDTFSGIENVTGSNFDDTLTGDADDNRLLGEGGSDVVNGLDGADLIGGGDGNDTLLGGSSGDLLMGGGGNDSLDGGADDDQLSGDVGDDTLLGQDGTDMLYGGTGNDRLEGGLGGDLLFGEDGDDTLEGGTGYEILDGGNGDDSLLGGDGNDYIEGGAGDDFVQGGAGDDAMDGGAGLDTAGFTLGRSAYTLTRTASGFSVSASGSSDGTDNLIGVERLKFADLGVALDLDDHAGTVVKILGAIFGAAMAASPVAVGIGLGLIDGGMSEAALMQYALDVRLGEGFTPAAEVDLLFQNLVGVAPTAEQLSYWTGTVTSGQYTPVALAQMAADLDLNTLNIGLVGLIDSGVTFTW